MSIFDSILLNVYRTRVYLPLFILGVVFFVLPQFRLAISKVSGKISQLNTVQISVIMFLTALILSVLFSYDGKSWGGDYSQYFAQARALATNTVDDWYAKNTFIIDTSAEGIGSDVYPWIWPILLMPVYKIFGFNIPVLKFYEALYFAGSMVPFVYILKRRISSKASFFICLAIVCNLSFLIDVNTVESDLPCLFITLLTINVIDMYHREDNNKSVKTKILWGLLTGVMIFIASETRTMNKALLLALVIYDMIIICQKIFKEKKAVSECFGIAFTMVMPFLSFAAVSSVFYTFLPKSGGTYTDYFLFSAKRLWDNILTYSGTFSELFCATSRPIISVISHFGLCIIAVLAIVGIIAKMRDELYIILYVGGTIAMLLFYDYISVRFVYIAYSLLIFLAYCGYAFLREKFKDKFWTDKLNLLFKDAYLLYIAMLLISICTVGVYIQTGRYSLRQADSPQAEEFYKYVNDNISDEAVVYFFKPRVLYLNTDVYSYTWYNNAEHMEAADYVGICIDDGYDKVHAYAEDNGKLIFENDYFYLYQLQDKS